MAHRTYVAIFIVILLLACKEQAAKLSTAADVPHALHSPAVLPQEMVNYLHQTFPQWRVVEKSDYSKMWWSFYDSSHNPCWVRTDINDDQMADYAVWLKKDAQLRLVICTGKAHQQFDHTIAIDSSNVFNEKEHNLSMGIAVAPPAQIDVVKPQIQSLILRSNGFILMELEERSRIYYWENGGIQTFYMK
jgi:hypothetical protein